MYFIFGLGFTVTIPDDQALNEHNKTLVDKHTSVPVSYTESCSAEYTS